MGKKMLLWFISGVSLIIALGALCDEFGILDPFRGMAIVFVLLMIVTRLIFDEAYRTASYQKTFFFYIVNAITSGILFISVLFTLNTLAPKLSALEEQRSPDSSLFQEYQDWIRNLEGDSHQLQERIKLDQAYVEQDHQQTVEFLERELEQSQRKVASLSYHPQWNDTYHNEEYGFNVRLSSPWEGYRVIKKEYTDENNVEYAYLYFQVPIEDQEYGDGSGYASPFTISVFPEKIWKEIKEDSGPHGKYIAEKDGKVFTFSGWQDTPMELMYFDFKIDKIIESFKFIEQGGE